MVVTNLIRDGLVAGGGVCLVVLAVELADDWVSPEQQKAIELSLAWSAPALWALRHPERPAGESTIVSAVVATMCGLTVRIVGWARGSINRIADRRAVRALEESRRREA